MAYLQPEEYATYCDMIPVTNSQVMIASAMIDAYVGTIGEESKFQKFSTTETVRLKRKGEIKLKNFPVLSIEKIVLIGRNCFASQSEYEMNVDEIQWDESGYIYFNIGYNRNIISHSWYLPMANTVRIEYTYGYEEVPKKVKLACAMLAMNISQVATFTSLDSMTTLDARFALANPSLFTDDIKALLDDYKWI